MSWFVSLVLLSLIHHKVRVFEQRGNFTRLKNTKKHGFIIAFHPMFRKVKLSRTKAKKEERNEDSKKEGKVGGRKSRNMKKDKKRRKGFIKRNMAL